MVPWGFPAAISQESLLPITFLKPSSLERYFEKQGYLQRDKENSYALRDGLDETDPALHPWQGCAITYLIAMGSQAGRKLMTLQTLVRVIAPRQLKNLTNAPDFINQCL